jgi:hypothetical protein
MILAYGSMRISEMNDSMVRKSFPPTFLYGTVEDRGSQSGMIDMYSRLFRAGVPVEAHFFQNGIHGTGFAVGDPVLGEWTKLLSNWLKGAGLLTSKNQISLGGVVKLDGSPLLKGMVILTPVNDPQSPPVIIYMNNTGTGELGRFMVPRSQGPVEGKYRVEVRQDATRWTSNSRDPFMIQMMDRQSKRTLTDADRKEWGEYLRKRNLSPSIYDQRVYSHRHPADNKDYIIDIKAGEVYHPVEGANGELGFYLISDGGRAPFRLHFRRPCFIYYQAYPEMIANGLLSDAVIALSSLNVIAGELDA